MSHYASLSIEHKKENGVFYTPQFLADYVASKLLYYFKSGTVQKRSIITLDPACGDGILLKSISKIANDISCGSISLYGVDKDPHSIDECDQNLSTAVRRSQYRLLTADSIQPFSFSNSVGWASILKELQIEDGFDLAISNPPWGAELNGYSRKALFNDFSLATGQFDIYNLFAEVILRQLKPNGYYAFILPDSVFNQEQWKFRKLLLETTELKLIARLGEKIFDNVNRACTVLVGKNGSPDPNNLVDSFRLTPFNRSEVLNTTKSLCTIEKELSHKIPQKRFLSNSKYLFDIDCRDSETDLIEKLQVTSYQFSDIVENSRGAEISKKGVVIQCNHCHLHLPYPKAKEPKCPHCKSNLQLGSLEQKRIIFSHNGNGTKKMKVGEDLSRYFSTNKRWIDITKEGINYKDYSLYKGQKILVRKTGIGITASLDNEGSVTNQVVYILKLKDKWQKHLTLEFVLAVLNSRIMTYYLLKKHGEIEWKSHPYLTQGILIGLPFPTVRPTKAFQASVDKITSLVLTGMKSNKKELNRQIDAAIEKEVAKLFSVNKSDYSLIYAQLESAEPLIPIKRLLDIDIKDIFS
ncbi:N-6 DNA methylase [Croceimicrobium sp.]|uniref:N-6 DNA methylase n=1 Tax=Croceimicrobium sp. TaxID=2828340 RepID=UPI003BAB6F23